MDLYGPVKVGGDTKSYCGKCKMELAHVIVSMVDNRPARVVCKTCKSQHNYKSMTARPRTRANSLSKPAAPKKVSVRQTDYWEQKLREKQGQPQKSYRVTDLFKQGEVIQHSKFGLGIVEEVKVNGKIIVLFRDEERTLVHGMGATPAP